MKATKNAARENVELWGQPIPALQIPVGSAWLTSRASVGYKIDVERLGGRNAGGHPEPMAEDESNNSEDDRTRKLRSLSVLHAKIDTCLRCAETIPGVEKLVGTKRGEPGRIFIVGEGPGRKEKEKGVAFAGGSGTRLNKWLVECGANPTDPRAGIYLTSVTKCIAPEKRALCEMVRKCRPFLIKQLQVLRPSLVITLGKPAYESLALSDLPYNRSLCRAQASTELLLLSELDFDYTLLPWPHPSGLNRWFNTPQNGDRLRASFSIVRRVLQGSS